MQTGKRPYRCRACTHRFHAPEHKRPRWRDRASFMVPALLMGAAIAAVIVVGARTGDETPAQNLPGVPIPIDPYTLRAAKEGDAAAQLRIAKTLLLDSASDRAQSLEAVRWLRAAADSQHPGAMVELGKLYRSGFGVLQDYDQAARWIRTAAARGNAEGMLELGRLYRDGIGFPRDPVRAYVWFNRAAAALNIDAVRDRDEIARSLDADELKQAQAQSSREESGEAEAEAVRVKEGNG
ncbi:tetratricopeptide repeat protein [Aromatoleum aromaticum]|uniref:tetratricopeptide repeat protein n=1 Tax=Aromatoleum aromaticum TaxID=551760 RepID=UPI001F52708D|nr:tetratricopeptide repeat protein [Aromatoleum aromaticum]